MSAPRLSSPAGRTVIIEWDPPSVPNGIIQKYLIQRRLIAGGNPSVISEVNASLPRRYVDNTAQPVTAYQYRIIAFNSGPGDPSPYSNITTGQGGMCGDKIKCTRVPSARICFALKTQAFLVFSCFVHTDLPQKRKLLKTVTRVEPFENASVWTAYYGNPTT